MDKVPALYEHSLSVYRAMEEEAQLAPLVVEDDAEGLVYEGFLTKLFLKLSFSVPYYSMITRELKRMGCIVQLRRGGSTTPSRWQLLGAPTQELYNEAAPERPEKIRKSRLTSAEQRINDLVKKINRLDEHVDILLHLHEDGTEHML